MIQKKIIDKILNLVGKPDPMIKKHFYLFLLVLILFDCSSKKEKIQDKLQVINISRGEITLCGAETAQFGKVYFSLSCAEKVRENFNLATALLHSFEYVEAEKVCAKVID